MWCQRHYNFTSWSHFHFHQNTREISCDNWNKLRAIEAVLSNCRVEIFAQSKTTSNLYYFNDFLWASVAFQIFFKFDIRERGWCAEHIMILFCIFSPSPSHSSLGRRRVYIFLYINIKAWFSVRMAHIFKKRAILNRSSFLHHHSFFSFIFFFDSWRSNDNVFEFEVFSSQHKKSQYGWFVQMKKRLVEKQQQLVRDDDLGWFKNNILYPILKACRNRGYGAGYIYVEVREESARGATRNIQLTNN